MDETSTERTIRLIREDERAKVLAGLRAEIEALRPSEDKSYESIKEIVQDDAYDNAITDVLAVLDRRNK